MTHTGRKLTSWFLTLVMIFTFMPVMTLQARADTEPVATVTVDSTTTEYDNFSEAISAWTAATEDPVLTLKKHIQTDSTIMLTGTKTLDLNGYGIMYVGHANAGVIQINNGNLWIKDSRSTVFNYIDLNDYRGFSVSDNETEDVTAGTGTVEINGGYITGGNAQTGSGGGVCIRSGTLTLEAGNIVGNTANHGGGVEADADSSVTMIGGRICYNQASIGGGVEALTSNIALNGWVDHNKAATGGGMAVSAQNNAEHPLELGAEIIIIGNINNEGAADNLYLEDGCFFATTEPLSGISYLGLYGDIDTSAFIDKKIGKVASMNDLEEIHSDKPGKAGVLYCDGEYDWAYINDCYYRLSGTGHTHEAGDLYLSTTAKSFTVTYDGNGGSEEMMDWESPYPAGSNVTVLSNGFTPPEGKGFKEWNTRADGDASGTVYHPDDTFTIEKDVTLYAQWTDFVMLDEDSKPVISFDPYHAQPQIGDTLTAECTATDVEYMWYQYEENGDAESWNFVGWGSTYTVKGTDLGKEIVVTAYQNRKADGSEYDYDEPVPQEESVAVGPVVKMDAPAAPDEVNSNYVSKNGTSLTISPTNPKNEYIVVPAGNSVPADGKWTAGGGSITFDGLTPSTSYDIYTRVRETEIAEASVHSTATTLSTTAYTATLTPEEPKVGSPVTVTVTPADDNLTYKWFADGEEIIGAAESSYIPSAADSGKVLSVVVEDSNQATVKLSATAPVSYGGNMTVCGTVYYYEGGYAYNGTIVKLMRGGEEFDNDTIDGSGRYSFDNVQAGIYNIVVTNDFGTKTELVELTASKICDIYMRLDRTNSELIVDDGTPAVMVGGLDEEAEIVRAAENVETYTPVTVQMTVSKVSEDSADEDEVEAIKDVAQGQTLEYIEINIKKRIGNAFFDQVSSTSKVLEIVIPYAFGSKKNVKVYRCHNYDAEELVNSKSGENGTYWLDTEKGYIHIFSSWFSTYAIGYAAEPQTQPSQGGRTSGGNPAINNDDITNGETSGQQPTDSEFDGYTDLNGSAWYADGVRYVLKRGIMQGAGGGLFLPDGVTTRAQMAQILFNMEGKPAYAGMFEFTDVDPQAWYAPAIRWAYAEGIMEGYGNGHFGPNDKLNREQLVTILYRFVRYKGVAETPDASILEFADAASVSSWAVEPFRWALQHGIINGVGSDTLAPQATATRAQIATIVMRYCE